MSECFCNACRPRHQSSRDNRRACEEWPGLAFYPIGYIQYATPVIKPAWLVFAQTAILQFLVAAFISLVVHLAVKIANNPTLGIVFVCALMGVTMVPGYYGRSIALREFALLNPLTYANTELTVGAYSPYPTTQIVNLPGLCFERGAIALVCAIGIEVLAISLLCVAGKSGCACPISPICLERGSFTASRTATRSSACASAVAYVRTMGETAPAFSYPRRMRDCNVDDDAGPGSGRDVS